MCHTHTEAALCDTSSASRSLRRREIALLLSYLNLTPILNKNLNLNLNITFILGR